MFSRVFAAVSCGLFVCLLLATTSVVHAGPLSEAERKQDPRLEKRITLLTPRAYYLGELLEVLSEQSGVALSASDKDRAAGEQVFVRLQDMPLCDVMNALWSLVSYKHATWDWSNGDDISAAAAPIGAGTFRYYLSRPRAAQSLADRTKELVQQEFEAEATTLLDGLNRTPEQVKELERRDKTAAAYLNDPGTRAGLEAFAETLIPEMRLRVLRRQEEALLPVSTLGKRGRAFIEAQRDIQLRIDPKANSPQPTYIKFKTEFIGGKMTPTMFILLGEQNDMGGNGYIGGSPREKAWQTKMTDLWLLDGDKTTDPVLERKVTSPKNLRLTPDEFGNVNMHPQEFLSRIAKAAPLSCLVRLPLGQAGEGGAPYGRTVREALSRLRPLQTKWRSGVLLVSSPGVLVNKPGPRSGVPWSAIKKLRQAEKAAPDGLLPIGDLAGAARALNREQLQALADEFPVLEQVAVWQDWFALMDRTPDLAQRLQNPQGVPVREVPVALRAKLPAQDTAEKIATVRMIVLDKHPEKRPAYRSIGFELLAADGKVLAHSGFGYHSREQSQDKGIGENAP